MPTKILYTRVPDNERAKVKALADTLGGTESDIVRLTLNLIDLPTLLRLVAERNQEYTVKHGQGVHL